MDFGSSGDLHEIHVSATNPTTHTFELREIVSSVEEEEAEISHAWVTHSLQDFSGRKAAKKFSKYSLNRALLNNARVALLSDFNPQL